MESRALGAKTRIEFNHHDVFGDNIEHFMFTEML